MPNIIVCPNCKKGLRVNGPVPAGKRVTCPACQNQFITGGNAPSAAVQAKKPPPMVSKSSPNSPANQGFSTKPQVKKTPRVDVVEEVEEIDDVEEVRPRGRRAALDDDDDRPRRRRDEDYDEDDDDRSLRRKKKKKKSGGSLGLILGLSGGGALLLILVITGFVWPGFFLSGRGAGAMAGGAGAAAPGGGMPVAGAPGEPNPLAFLPGDSNLVAGINVTQVRNLPQFQGIWNGLQNPGQPLAHMPPELRNLIDTTENFMVAGHIDRTELPIVVLVTGQPYDPEKIKPHLGAPMTIQGQTVYPDKVPNPKQTFIAMPSSKILLVSQLPAEQFAALIARGNNVQIHADLQQQVGTVRGSLFWMAMRFDDSIKLKMQEALQNPAPGAPPDFNNIAGIVQRSKGFNLTVDVVQNQTMKLSVGLNCNDANDAGQLRGSMQNLWNTEGKKMVEGFRALGGQQLNPLINEVTQSLAFDQRDATAAMTLQINLKTIQQMANAQNNPGFNLPFGPGGFNPPIPGFNMKKGPAIRPPGFKKKF